MERLGAGPRSLEIFEEAGNLLVQFADLGGEKNAVEIAHKIT